MELTWLRKRVPLRWGRHARMDANTAEDISLEFVWRESTRVTSKINPTESPASAVPVLSTRQEIENRNKLYDEGLETYYRGNILSW